MCILFGILYSHIKTCIWYYFMNNKNDPIIYIYDKKGYRGHNHPDKIYIRCSEVHKYGEIDKYGICRFLYKWEHEVAYKNHYKREEDKINYNIYINWKNKQISG